LARFEFKSEIVSFCFSFTFVLFGESHLLVSWCAGGMCGMACRDEDRGRSRRPGAEDRGWSHKSGIRWPGGREVGHRRLHQVGWHLLRPTTAASLELLPQIQHLGCPQQQRVPHHPPSLLHLQAERETSNVTAAKGLDVLCTIAPPSVFWS
jgi:hypothetical protein